LRQTAGGSNIKYIHGPGLDEPLAEEDGTGVLTHLHADALGSVVKHSSASGVVVHEYRYDSWGSPETGGSKSGYAFTGREWDAATELSYYRARYYDAKAGRFVSEDPIRTSGGMNFYAYVFSNPVNHLDPTGLKCCRSECPSGMWTLMGGVSFGGGLIAGKSSSWGELVCMDRPFIRRTVWVLCDMYGPYAGGGAGFDWSMGAPAKEGVRCAEDLQPFSSKGWTVSVGVVSFGGEGRHWTNFGIGPSKGGGAAWTKCDILPQ
jgi:RHS repeat-associated protein